MEINRFYTKGDSSDIVSRIGTVHTITIFCPLQDAGIQLLKSAFENVIPQYKKSENRWDGVPAVDALYAFLFAAKYCTSMGLVVDKHFISLVYSSLKMFNRLKYINFEYTNREDIFNSYTLMSKNEKEGVGYTYNVELLEIYLADMFSQTIIDLLNKVFIHNGLISNSYLERKFKLEFSYDEYHTFMDMFIGNNQDRLNLLDANICDYFKAFPKLVEEQKPRIRIITNYEDEATE